MADPVTTLPSELISAGLNPNNPSQTYVDFANQMAQNQQQQALQEQQIAKAKELTTQAQLQTGQEEEANAAGANPLLENLMTPDEAVAYLNLILKEKGLTINAADINAWKATLPQQVNREIVEAFANRFSRETTRSGQPSQFTTDQDIKVPSGKSAADLGLEYDDSVGKKDTEPSDGTDVAHVPADGMYQVIYDNQGNVLKFIPGGKAAAPAASNAKQAQFDANRWSKLSAAIDMQLKSTRGNQLSTAIYRADRALNELASPDVLIPQVLSYIGKDISGIFQGGVPPQAAMEDEQFETAYQRLNGFVQKYTGVSGFFRTDLGNQRQILISLVTRLRDSTLDILEKLIKSEAPGFEDIVNADPDRWLRLLNAKIAAISGGLTATAGAATAAAAAPVTAQPIPGVQSAPAAPAAAAPANANPLNLKF